MKTKTLFIVLIGIFAFSAMLFEACKKEEKFNHEPLCKITSPLKGQDITKGEMVSIIVDATDSDGSITEVQFFIDGTIKSLVNSSPYKHSWNTIGESTGNHTLEAKSFDNRGSSASDIITVVVNDSVANTAPTASFIALPDSGTINTIFIFDANASTDNEDDISQLQIRWDYNDDGDWDTEWDFNKIQYYQYETAGNYAVKLEVMDTEGLSGEITDTISVNSLPGTYTDIRDGQVYNIVVIGDQTWFAENLNYEVFNSWWYDNSSANGSIYGRLYTWEAAITACPVGWHLPGNDEWRTLEMYLGMSQSESDQNGWRGTDEGKKLKSTSGWDSNGNGTDAFNFAGLPGGMRYGNGVFVYLGLYGNWWTATESSDSTVLHRALRYDGSTIGRHDHYKERGLSVRCLKN